MWDGKPALYKKATNQQMQEIRILTIGGLFDPLSRDILWGVPVICILYHNPVRARWYFGPIAN